VSGPIAADGSPVELYARLPTFGEPELVHDALPDGAEILELGCGAGRMTHRLLELGHPVTAVDSSPEMLAHVRGARVLLTLIEELRLPVRFDCVLLASHLVNVAEDEQRRGFLATCARHVRQDGRVLVQRYDPDWASDPSPSERTVEGMTVRVVEARRVGPMLLGTVEYEVDGRTWRHGPFTSRILEDDELSAELDRAGLRLDRWLDERRSWFSAILAGDT
jgi:SAM-dependent methyltransferase